MADNPTITTGTIDTEEEEVVVVKEDNIKYRFFCSFFALIYIYVI